MSRGAKKLGGWVAGLAVVGALVFGLTVTLATPANAMTCANDGWNWLGYKATPGACFTSCKALHPELVEYRYSVLGCCTCLF